MNRRFGPNSADKNPEESTYVPTKYAFTWKGRRVSHDWFKKANLALLALMFEPRHVLELGAGYGQVGRLLMLIRDGIKYTVIDLPETLYFAEIYLRLNLPKKKIVFAKSVEDFKRAYDALLVPASLAEDYARTETKADVFLNSSSLGEMDNATSAFYLGIIQEMIKPKYAILLNRMLNTYGPIVDNFREREAGWYFLLDRRWEVLRWELEPDFTRIPYTELLHHRELLWIAKRTGRDQIRTIGESTRLQYWFSHFTRRPSVRCGNLLMIDAELVKELFEAVRTGPTPDNVGILLYYLHCIGKRQPFEEETILFDMYRRNSADSTGKGKGPPHPLDPGQINKFIRRTLFAICRVINKFRY